MRTLQTVTVPQSGQVSGAFAIGRSRDIAIMFPVLTSCAAFLLGSIDTTSANFVRVHTAVGSGPHQVFPGAGSAAAIVELQPFAFAKIELSRPQADVRSLEVISSA